LDGKSFGFINDVFIHPKIVIREKLVNGMIYQGFALKSYNQEQQRFSWKLI